MLKKFNFLQERCIYCVLNISMEKIQSFEWYKWVNLKVEIKNPDSKYLRVQHLLKSFIGTKIKFEIFIDTNNLFKYF
jgi:hypothetical protein